MIRKTFGFIKKFDLFGHILTFEENDSNYFKTSIGSLLSYLLIICILIACFIFGQEIYKRETPIMVTGEEIVGKQDLKVLLRDFPYIMSLNSKNAGPILNDYRELLNVEIWYMNMTPEGVVSREVYFGFSECDVEIFNEDLRTMVSEIMEGLIANGWLPRCIIHKGKEEYSVANKFSFPDSDFILMKIMDCDEKYRNSIDYVNKDSEIFTNAPKCNPNRREITDSFVFKFDLINSI